MPGDHRAAGPDHRWDKAKPQMTQFWLERNCGWLPPAVRMKMSGSIGHYDLSKLTDGQLDALEKLLEPIAIETAEGRGVYEAEQRRLSALAEPVRARLITELERALA